jgi:hypothetical protein
VSEQKRFGCDPEKCAKCDISEESKAICAYFNAMIERIAATPQPARAQVHFVEALNVMYQAMRVMFIVAPSVSAGVDKVTSALNHVLNLIEPTYGRIDIDIVDASGAVDKVTEILQNARDRAQLNVDLKGATKH